MLNVLGASVIMQNVRFGKNFGEDQLNLINSKVEANGLTFEQAYSDAADFDWCRGSISNVAVTETGEGATGSIFRIQTSSLVMSRAVGLWTRVFPLVKFRAFRFRTFYSKMLDMGSFQKIVQLSGWMALVSAE